MPQIISGCVSLEQIYHIKLKQKLDTSYNYQSKGVISLILLQAKFNSQLENVCQRGISCKPFWYQSYFLVDSRFVFKKFLNFYLTSK